MRSSWQQYEGTRYLLADYSNFGRDIDALREEVNQVDTEIEREADPSTLLLCDFRNTVTSSDVVSLFKQSATRTKGLVQKTAVIGLTGVQKILVAAVARFSGETLHLFLDPEQAKRWLAGGDEELGIRVPLE